MFSLKGARACVCVFSFLLCGGNFQISNLIPKGNVYSPRQCPQDQGRPGPLHEIAKNVSDFACVCQSKALFSQIAPLPSGQI